MIMPYKITWSTVQNSIRQESISYYELVKVDRKSQGRSDVMVLRSIVPTFPISGRCNKCTKSQNKYISKSNLRCRLWLCIDAEFECNQVMRARCQTNGSLDQFTSFIHYHFILFRALAGAEVFPSSHRPRGRIIHPRMVASPSQRTHSHLGVIYNLQSAQGAGIWMMGPGENPHKQRACKLHTNLDMNSGPSWWEANSLLVSDQTFKPKS